MNTTAHSSYAFLIYALILYLFWGIVPTGIMSFLIIIAGIAPDFDAIYYKLVKRGDLQDNNFQHHLFYWTHWPSSYIPVVIAFVFSLVFNFYPQYFLIAVVGVYSHMLFDSVSCGDGLMPTATWWKVRRGEFARFYNFDAEKTDGYHGQYWTARYRRTKYFILENIAASVVIILLLNWALIQSLDIWHVLSLVGSGGLILIGLKGVNPKFDAEPPQGRYADYHSYPPYVKWYQKKYGDLPPKKYGIS